MSLEEKIKRINELYHKSQNEGLSSEEVIEQGRLRKEYIESVKRNIKSQLNNIDMVDTDGKVVNLGETHGQKETTKQS